MAASSGRYLRAVRLRPQLGVREVQEASPIIARYRGSFSFYVAASRPAQIENEASIPAIYQLFSLCAIYGFSFHRLLLTYEVGLDTARCFRECSPSGPVRPPVGEVHRLEDTATQPFRLDPNFRRETAQLVNHLVALWEGLPAPSLIHHNPRSYAYGYVELVDRRMFPVVRPGSLLLIDPERRRTAKSSWKDEFDRPIYFVETLGEYRCEFCQGEWSRLLLISQPYFGEPVRTFSLEGEAEIAGQVVGVAMRLAPANRTNPEPAPELAKPIDIVK